MLDRKKYILASNWKANFTLEEAINWFEIVSRLNYPDLRIIAAIPYPYIHYFATRYNNIDVFSQNISHVLGGAYTGEVTISMLKSVGFRGSIVGHSERRHLFNESNQIINKKVLILQENSTEIILCIGETLEERKEGKTERVLYDQIISALNGFSRFELLTVAYEPVWAIGTGIPISPHDLTEAERFIRKIFEDKFGVKNIILLYGGSVDKEFAKVIRNQTTLDGALIGSASWKPHNFEEIIRIFVEH
ncbi:MAG: triose-phosphate isomerase [Candidatus Calescibacterium sp.]|nr:triose-phosphate isomerase [Candidatus Calescibacterium sp.]MCX7971758.1 triose-phosphate isomerase [bacterium]MDW8195364.1 triose-phosphate isomerase [Candidatus Calescibacterium sp.]